MRKNWVDDGELEDLDLNITDEVMQKCEQCKFLTALRVIDSIDIELVKELNSYTESRMADLEPWLTMTKDLTYKTRHECKWSQRNSDKATEWADCFCEHCSRRVSISGLNSCLHSPRRVLPFTLPNKEAGWTIGKSVSSNQSRNEQTNRRSDI